jgi:hypothetical protein
VKTSAKTLSPAEFLKQPALTASAHQHTFIKLWNNGEAEGTQKSAASETTAPLAAIKMNL